MLTLALALEQKKILQAAENVCTVWLQRHSSTKLLMKQDFLRLTFIISKQELYVAVLEEPSRCGTHVLINTVEDDLAEVLANYIAEKMEVS